MNGTVVGALVAALVASLVTYLIARRQTSGRIDTTEAATLWEEAKVIRQELRDLAIHQAEKIDQLGRDAAEAKRVCDEKIAQLVARLYKLEERAERER